MDEPQNDSPNTSQSWTEYALITILQTQADVRARQDGFVPRLESIDRRLDLILSQRRTSPIQSPWYRDFQMWLLILLIGSAATGIITVDELRSVLLQLMLGT